MDWFFVTHKFGIGLECKNNWSVELEKQAVPSSHLSSVSCLVVGWTESVNQSVYWIGLTRD